MSHAVPAAVRVPCSTSNLGSGFDTVGLALDRYLDARFRPEPDIDGLALERRGTLSELDLPLEEDLAVRAFREGGREAGWTPRGVLTLDSRIPLARGLGSSAAALVAGHALARVALGRPVDQEAAFQLAAAIEGHGDNAAPCAFGGLRGVVRGEVGPRMIPLELSPDVGIAYAAPAVGVSTRDARTALPATVDHATAVGELGLLVALLRGLAGADPALVRLGVGDALHVPYRLPLIPGAADAIAAGYEAGAWGVTISGAGSGLVALCAPTDTGAVARAMHAALAPEGGPPGSLALALQPDTSGVRAVTR